jgi:P27 family predicted phage terminase small subunit
MGARGRKSASEIDMTPPLALVPPSLPVELPAPPSHLSSEAAAWWRQTVANYDLEPHHLKLLECACDAWDRMIMAREELRKYGITAMGEHGPKMQPAVIVERDARVAFARLVRELDLDEPTPPPGRYVPPPSLRSNRRR